MVPSPRHAAEEHVEATSYSSRGCQGPRPVWMTPSYAIQVSSINDVCFVSMYTYHPFSSGQNMGYKRGCHIWLMLHIGSSSVPSGVCAAQPIDCESILLTTKAVCKTLTHRYKF